MYGINGLGQDQESAGGAVFQQMWARMEVANADVRAGRQPRYHTSVGSRKKDRDFAALLDLRKMTRGYADFQSWAVAATRDWDYSEIARCHRAELLTAAVVWDLMAAGADPIHGVEIQYRRVAALLARHDNLSELADVMPSAMVPHVTSALDTTLVRQAIPQYRQLQKIGFGRDR